MRQCRGFPLRSNGSEDGVLYIVPLVWINLPMAFTGSRDHVLVERKSTSSDSTYSVVRDSRRSTWILDSLSMPLKALNSSASHRELAYEL